ncbi:MAG: dihydrolipoyl dehydrogenase [Elusimicrobiaceae bacterium]|nr:dihydrolipoyl dehydrogenase [Elusimicrobiaceae bacterium]
MTKKILVIGAGPGGYPAAAKAAALGAEVTLVEKAHPGGVCLNWGCIPSKSLLDAAHRFEVLHDLPALLEPGAEAALSDVAAHLSWAKISARRQALIEKLRGNLMRLFKSLGIDYVQGTARFLSDREAEIETGGGRRTVAFDAAIIAAGTRPFFPKPFDALRAELLDNTSVFGLEKLPGSVAIIGAGAIGAEFSCVFHSFGVQTHLVELQPGVLPGMDPGVGRAVAAAFKKKGINLHLGVSADSVALENGKKLLHLSDGTQLHADEVLVAVGRVAELGELALEKAGLEWDRRGIKVDSRLRTVKPHIYAVGDVNGLALLAHAAEHQGDIAACNALGHSEEYDNELVPGCIYTRPEAACVGLDRERAEKKGHTVKVGRAFFLSSGRALSQDEPDGFVQVVSDEKTGKILGGQIVGHTATELIHIFSVAIRAGLTVPELKKVMFAHPTMSETIKEALSR